jgi:glutamate carboxypeptidase
VLLTALEALERSPWADGVSWEVLLNPDEEIGSPGSAALLDDAALNNDVGLLFEPALTDGSLVGERPGSGGFAVVVRGKAAHAGREPHLGRNAINALAEFIVDLNAFPADHPEVIVNVGAIKGGGPVNIVPDLAICRFNARVTTDDARGTFEAFLSELASTFNARDGISLEVHGRFGRPPKPVEGRTLELLRAVVGCAGDMGLALQWRASGGTSDGNNLVAAGLPTVDSLGVRGGGIHSSDEFVFVDSLAERARLTALLLMKLGAGDIAVPR